MAFIDRMIGQHEKIIYRLTPHWIYLVQGVLLLILILIAGHVIDHEIKQYIRQALSVGHESDMLWFFYIFRSYIFWGGMLFGIGVFLQHLIFYRSTHIAITSDRLIYKTGMLFVNVHESALDEIKGEQVHNGFFGRFLDYGFVNIDCRFVKNMRLPAIPHPYAFLHNMREQIKDSAKAIKGQQEDIFDMM